VRMLSFVEAIRAVYRGFGREKMLLRLLLMSTCMIVN